MTKANNSAAMRENNMRVIVNLVRKRPQSRADIARVTGLSRAAVTILTDALVENGILINGDAVKSEAGRRPTLLQLNPGAFVSVGIDLCREGFGFLLSDFSGNILFKEKTDFLETADQTVDRLCDRIRLALDAIQGGASVLGVCICAPGPIDTKEGKILTPSGLALFHNYNIKHEVESRLSFPTYLEKDTNALAIAEKNREELCGDLLFLLADHGIGCSIIKDGHLFVGRDGLGGELGHTTVDLNGPICSCGNVGCAELYASVPATVQCAEESDWESLIAKAKSGNAKAVEALQKQGRILSALCVNAVNLFEPRNVVLGGKLAAADFVLNPMIQAALNRSAFSRNVHGYFVCSSCLGENARAYAAAMTAAEYYFNGGSNL